MASSVEQDDFDSSAPVANFSQALATWRQINLTELQKTLDRQGLEIVDGQKENMVGRKKLAEQTREFKKVPDEEKGLLFRPLLKAYQTEIDALTRRSKTAENSFLSVYKLLAEAPDPFPLLDAAVDQTARASEARLLESEVARQKDEISSLRAQLVEAQSIEKARAKLQAQVDKYESKMEDMISEKVAAKEAELHATYDERLRNYEEREQDLTRQVAVARAQLKELRTTNDSSQAKLFDHSQRQDQETVARLAEADLVAEDLERANKRVADVERRNEKLRAEIEAVRSGSEATARATALESQIADLQTEAARLLRALDTQKEAAAQAEAVAKRSTDELVKERDSFKSQVAQLQAKVDQFSDYDELKRELDIMKFVEFTGLEVDDDDEGNEPEMPDPNADKANRQRGKPLENLLMAKNHKLQDELTSFRVAHEELVDSHRSLSSELDSLRSRFEEQSALNERLENDLLRINQSSNERSGASIISPGSREDPLASLNIGRHSSNNTQPSSHSTSAAATVVPIPTASASTAISISNPASTVTPTTTASTGGAPVPSSSSAESSILPIITSQRDRFRQRNAELEEELRKQFEALSNLRSEIKALQTDNLKLYEKVRYLQSYRDETLGRSPAAGGGSISRDTELGKYHNRYEESMNPFEAFRGRERGRAVQMLNPLEKVLLSLASVVLSNRLSRNIFVVYAFGLHFVVLSALYGAVASSETAPATLPPI